MCRAHLQESALNRHTVRPFTESDDTICCNNTICPPEDEHSTPRNMLRIIMYHIYCYRIKELCIKLVRWNKATYNMFSCVHIMSEDICTRTCLLVRIWKFQDDGFLTYEGCSDIEYTVIDSRFDEEGWYILMRRVGIFWSLYLFLIVIYIRALAIVQNKEWWVVGGLMNDKLKEGGKTAVACLKILCRHLRGRPRVKH